MSETHERLDEPWVIAQEEILESELLEIAERDGIPAVLNEIKENPPKDLTGWQLVWGVLLHLQQERGYQKGWLAYKAEELSAPIEFWRQLALYFGYKSGWAYHRWRELQEKVEESNKQSSSAKKKK
jgi:hypothetical protein